MLVKTPLSVNEGGVGSKALQLCVTSFMNALKAIYIKPTNLIYLIKTMKSFHNLVSEASIKLFSSSSDTNTHNKKGLEALACLLNKNEKCFLLTYLHDNYLFFHPVMQRACKISELLHPFLAFNIEKLKLKKIYIDTIKN